MNLVQSEPKLAIQVTKPTFVVIPVAIEINRAVQSLLKHSPSSTVRCLVAEYIKGSQIIRFNGVHTVLSLSSFVNVSTIFFQAYEQMEKIAGFNAAHTTLDSRSFRE